MSDLIDRQTLVARMEAQEQAYTIEENKPGIPELVKPSWNLAKDMIADMPGINFQHDPNTANSLLGVIADLKIEIDELKAAIEAKDAEISRLSENTR